MADRPIIFSAPMVRALLAGRKTQTRRVIKDAPYGEWFADRDGPGDWRWVAPEGRPTMPIRLPYAPGDRLWVREAWQTSPAYEDLAPSDLSEECPILYLADGWMQDWGMFADQHDVRRGRKRVGMHMPRWASRLTLLVAEVRVRRVQSITGTDAKAEGITAFPRDPSDPCWGVSRDGPMGENPRDAFRDLWDSLNGKRAGASWDENPWVVAYTFSVERSG